MKMARGGRVSIGVPIFNGARFLPAMLDSLLAQTFQDLEIVISDNASTDSTSEISRDYAAMDCRIRYLRNSENVGLGRNHNLVFLHSTGEYFKWAPADDIYLPEYIARCVEVLDADASVVLTHSRTKFIDDQDKTLNANDPGWNLMSDYPAERLRRSFGPNRWANVAVGLVRREAMLRTRLMPSYSGGDFRVLAELALQGKFYEIPEYLFLRRLHAGSSSQNTESLKWETEYWNGNGNRLGWPFLNLQYDHALTILRSKMPLGDKVSVGGSWLRNIIGSRSTFFKEMRAHWTFLHSD